MPTTKRSTTSPNPVTHRIHFEPVGRRGDCPADQSLLACARELGVELVSVCGGAGTCGRCKVKLVTGELSDSTPSERAALTEQELSDGYRLACQAWPRSDCKLHVPPASLTTPQRTQVEGQEIAVGPDPSVERYPIELPPPSLGSDDTKEDIRDDQRRVLDALREQHRVEAERADIDVLRHLSPSLREADWRVSVALRGGEVIDVGPSSRPTLGLAVDLGTTKIAAYLLDLESGRTLSSRGAMNPQISYGEDLVARLVAARRSPEEAGAMQAAVVDRIGQMAGDLCAEGGANPIEVVDAVIVGNTAMHHLLLGLPVAQLVASPYLPMVKAALDVKARDMGLSLAPGAYVHTLPNIAGYVGADHVAMLLATQVARAEGVVLALDIGTNTEVCLVNEDRMTTVSCASGPAFEGAQIKHGMRAAQGAIEYLELTDDGARYQTIGDGPPAGLCGSGILDALAELFRKGIVDAGGRMREGPRVRTSNRIREFVLVSEEERENGAITVTQKDVRELQLAKGAIRAGIWCLLDSEGLSESDIDEVVIAGAFGSYIDVASAITIGMLPRLPETRFRQVGNAAGMGAKLALLSRAKREEASEIANRTHYIELSTDPAFKPAFTRATQLGDAESPLGRA